MKVDIVSYGAGTNSTAMLIEMHRRGIVPKAILFADTGSALFPGEKTGTYAFVKLMDAWLKAHDMPPITTVRQSGMYDSLYTNCMSKQMLPSVVYGDEKRSCSQKFKHAPQEKWANNEWWCQAMWKEGKRVVKAIGIDAGERPGRSKIKESEDGKYAYIYPLIVWGLDRDDNAATIKAEGFPNPGKSSCFFCPASTKAEVRWLAKNEPELFARAVAMERNALPNLDTVKGLGRHWTWEEVAKADKDQLKLFTDPVFEPCRMHCWDGDEFCEVPE